MIEFRLIRFIFNPKYTIGHLYWCDNYLVKKWTFFSDSLEDRDRGLTSAMTISEIEEIKIPGATAIPYGTYPLCFTWSARFHEYIPHLMNVPGFTGVRIHNGNMVDDAGGGSILLGEDAKDGEIKNNKFWTKRFGDMILPYYTDIKTNKLLSLFEQKKRITNNCGVVLTITTRSILSSRES